MGGFYKENQKGAKNAVAEDGRWLISEAAIVADVNDPENQHRIRVIIPSIDEDLIYDEWVRPAAVCLGDGFGSVFIPKKGTEVFITGVLGQKFNLFYSSTYNEENLISDELNEETPGIHAPENLKFIAEDKMTLKGGEVEIKGGKVRIDGDGTITISGGVISISGDVVKINNRIVNKVGPPI